MGCLKLSAYLTSDKFEIPALKVSWLNPALSGASPEPSKFPLSGVTHLYAFNGMEKDNEVASISGVEGDDYTAEFWEYDSRLGRRWNLDPVPEPSQSPYAPYRNNPIVFVDPNGAFETKFGALLYSLFHGGKVSRSTNGEYNVSKSIKIAGGEPGVVNIGMQVRYDWNGRNHMVNDATGAYHLGWEFVTGTGPREHNFTNGDPFLEELQKSDWMDNARKIVENGIRTNSGIIKGDPNYELGDKGWRIPILLMKDILAVASAGTFGNLSVAYLGSYKLNYVVTSTDIQKRTAIVQFTAVNQTTASSVTRPPWPGYTQWWGNNVSKPLDKLFPTGPLSKTTQTLNWTETIKW